MIVGRNDLSSRLGDVFVTEASKLPDVIATQLVYGFRVGVQTIKAARINPVQCIKSE